MQRKGFYQGSFKDMFRGLEEEVVMFQHLYLGDFLFEPKMWSFKAKELLNYTKTELELLVAKQDRRFVFFESDDEWY